MSEKQGSPKEGELETPEILWNYLVELRKEVVQNQRIRTQIIGFKITFISAFIGILATKITFSDGAKVPIYLTQYGNLLFVIPAFSAIFFDFLIHGYCFSIKRIGIYVEKVLEPKLITEQDVLLWQTFLTKHKEYTTQHFTKIGNWGLTFISILIAIISLCYPYNPKFSPFLIFSILAFFAFDIISYGKVEKLKKITF